MSAAPIVLYQHAPWALRQWKLEDFCRRLCAELCEGRPFTVLISNDAALRRLNRDFLKHDYATDVLSFPAPPGAGQLGDIAVSHQRASAQAAALGHPAPAELRILILHGVLHLLGFDHETDNGEMRRAESRWRKRLGLTAPGLIERPAAC